MRVIVAAIGVKRGRNHSRMVNRSAAYPYVVGIDAVRAARLTRLRWKMIVIGRGNQNRAELRTWAAGRLKVVRESPNHQPIAAAAATALAISEVNIEGVDCDPRPRMLGRTK